MKKYKIKYFYSRKFKHLKCNLVSNKHNNKKIINTQRDLFKFLLFRKMQQLNFHSNVLLKYICIKMLEKLNLI